MEPHAVRLAMPLAKPNEQWFFVLQGRLEITVGQESYCLSPGDSIYFEGNLLRQFGSASDEELVVIFCVTPPTL
jgi:quercetin dioxygenase-like cupin family protein